MTPSDFKSVLQQTLADHSLARTEKGILRAAMHSLQPDARTLSLLRSQAWELARAELSASPGKAIDIVNWLEEVNKALMPSEDATDDLCEAFFSPHDNCPGRIRSLLAAAKRSADLCVFTITDDRLAESIMDAHQRGVVVRIITDNDKSMDLGSDADRLRTAGIDLRLDRSAFHMHHKFAIFDGTVLLNGSYNWTRGAAQDNEENFTVQSDPRLIKSFAAAFEALWKQVGK